MPTAQYRYFRIVARQDLLPAVCCLLEAEGFRFEPEEFSPFCFRLTHEPFALGASLAALFGYIYIQDRSSMLPPLALNPAQGSPVLDMAASPGSKSGFLCQLTGENGLVLANEPNRARLATLAANLQTLNLLQGAVCSYPGETLPLNPRSWPYILLDPPCSGWGTAQKNPAAPRIWQGERIKPLIHLQRALLTKAAELLAPGGLLLYSTCTTNPQENQEQTAWAVNELGLEPLRLPAFPGMTAAETAHRGLLIDGEVSKAQGFYLSLLLKPGEPPPKPEIPDDLPLNASLASPVFDPALMPAGIVRNFNDKARFLPALSRAMLPQEFAWRGFMLGKLHNGLFSPQSRLRVTLPPYGPRVVLENCAEARRLLSGAQINTGQKEAQAGLWLNDLPLAVCRIKNGRVTLRLGAG